MQARIPIELSRLLVALVAKDKAQRPASVHALVARLRAWLQGQIMPECPCTTVKYTFEHLTEWLNNHPLLAPVFLLWLLYPALVVIQLLLDKLLWKLP